MCTARPQSSFAPCRAAFLTPMLMRPLPHAGNSFFAQVHTSGNLTVHNGATGAVVAHAWALPSVDTTAVPSLAVYKNRFVYLTAPQWGQVRVVDVTLPTRGRAGSARVVHPINVGGRPLRLLLVD